MKNAGATDQQIGLINSVQTMALMFAYFLWANQTQKRGKRWVLLASALKAQPLLHACAGTPHK